MLVGARYRDAVIDLILHLVITSQGSRHHYQESPLAHRAVGLAGHSLKPRLQRFLLKLVCIAGAEEEFL